MEKVPILTSISLPQIYSQISTRRVQIQSLLTNREEQTEILNWTIYLSDNYEFPTFIFIFIIIIIIWICN